MYLKKSVFICFLSGMLALSLHAENKPAMPTLSFRSTSVMLQSPVPSGSTTYRATPFVHRTTPRPMAPAMRMISTSSYFGGATPAYFGGTTPYAPGSGNGPNRRGARKAYHPGAETDGEGNYWDEEEEAWLPIPGETPSYGDQRFINGAWYWYNGSDWVLLVEAPSEMVPVGDMPWVLMLCLAIIYMLVLKFKKNRYEI